MSVPEQKKQLQKTYLYQFMKFINLTVKYMNSFAANWGMEAYTYLFIFYVNIHVGCEILICAWTLTYL